MRNFCNESGLLSHDAKACPIRIHDNDENPHDPDEHGDNAAVEVNDQPLQGNIKFHKELVLEPMYAGFDNKITRTQTLQHLTDNDLATETVRYLQAKMAKWKFT